MIIDSLRTASPYVIFVVVFAAIINALLMFRKASDKTKLGILMGFWAVLLTAAIWVNSLPPTSSGSNPTAPPTPAATLTPTLTPTPTNTPSNLPKLTSQGFSTIHNEGDLPVLTGPGPNYYRSASGDAAVPNNKRVNVYGGVGSYLLIEYATERYGEDITRFAYASANNVSNAESFGEIKFATLPITIDIDAKLLDSPSLLRKNGYTSIVVDRNNAIALASYEDDSEVKWTYFQSTGYSSYNNSTLPVRGFVLGKDVNFK